MRKEKIMRFFLAAVLAISMLAMPLTTAYAESVVFLSMPMTVKCKPDCKGLCPVCGTDLNVSQCSCGRADTPSETRKPFAALEDLLTRDEEV